MLERLFPRILILSGEKIDMDSISSTNSLDFIIEVKTYTVSAPYSITYKNSGKSDKYRCNGGNGWRQEPKLPAMDDNIRNGKIGNCRTITIITMV